MSEQYHQANGKRPTMADVAARAGVSRALVSTVFRDVPGASATTRERVLQAAADLGYRMDNRARMLRRSRTRLLGVVFQIQNAFHSDLVEALYTAATDADYDLALSATTPGRPEGDAVESLLHDRCEALLLISPQLKDRQLAELAERAPTFVMARRINHPSIDVIRTADAQVVDTALEHLTSLGHRRIAHLDGRQIHGASDRRRNYRHLMRKRGLEEYVRVLPGGNTEADGMQAAAQLIAEGDLPTAVIAFNDSSAVGLIFGLRAAGVRVPEDISVMGYDDVHMAALPFISLSTVGQDVVSTARHAVEHAVARLDNGSTPGAETLVSPYLAARHTTTTAPAT